jgi:prepilin-type N-terminal cleavage/methylation domain-containing protein
MEREAVLGDRGKEHRGVRRASGFSLPELLAVFALIAIVIAIGIPIVNEQIRIAEVRAVADDLVLHLRAARVLSVTKHKTITFTIFVDPTNKFKYEGNDGKDRTFETPSRVRIAPASDHTIDFKDNGSVSVPSTVIIESDVSGSCERWTATVSTMGLTKLAHERVNL